MKLGARKMLVLVGCGLVASSVYACGIELEGTDGGSDSGATSSGVVPGTSSSGGSSSGGSGSTSSSSGTPSGSSGASSGDLADASTDGPDGSTCVTTTILGADTGCSSEAGTNAGIFQGHDISCTRSADVSQGPSLLTSNDRSREGAVWYALPLSMTGAFTVEAVVSVKAADNDVGAGFAVAFLTPDDSTPAVLPGTGGSGPLLGSLRLSGFSGVAALVRNYLQVTLASAVLPTAATAVTGPSAGQPEREQRYQLRISHEVGMGPLRAELSRDTGGVIAPIDIPVAGTAVEAESAIVGITASTGEAYRSEQQLVSLTITRCD